MTAPININIKSSLSQLAEIGDIAIDPSTFTINTLTPDGIKQMVTTGISSIGPVGSSSITRAPTVEDNRPTIAEKPLAMQVAITDFERLSNNDAQFMLRLINDASEKLRRAVMADTRCGGCHNMTLKVEQREDMMRAETRHILSTECRVRQPGMVGLVCPDGRASSVKPLALEDYVTVHHPSQVTPKADPDKPSTTFDETW